MKESGISTGGREDDKFPHANSMQLSIDSGSSQRTGSLENKVWGKSQSKLT
jgi:hypothetical protein